MYSQTFKMRDNIYSQWSIYKILIELIDYFKIHWVLDLLRSVLVANELDVQCFKVLLCQFKRFALPGSKSWPPENAGKYINSALTEYRMSILKSD